MEYIPSTPKTVKNVAKDEPAESGPRVVTVAGQKYEVRVINKKRLMIPIGSPPTLHRRRAEYDRLASSEEVVLSEQVVPSARKVASEGVTPSIGEMSSAKMALNQTPSSSTQTLIEVKPSDRIVSDSVIPSSPPDPSSVTLLPSTIQQIQSSQTPLKTPHKTQSLPSRPIRLQPKREVKTKSQDIMKRSVEKRHRSEGGEPRLKRVKVHKITSTSMWMLECLIMIRQSKSFSFLASSTFINLLLFAGVGLIDSILSFVSCKQHTRILKTWRCFIFINTWRCLITCRNIFCMVGRSSLDWRLGERWI